MIKRQIPLYGFLIYTEARPLVYQARLFTTDKTQSLDRFFIQIRALHQVGLVHSQGRTIGRTTYWKRA